jgi:hypothetical protein
MLGARRYEGMHVWAETLPGESHASMVGMAITHGLKAVFGDSPAIHAAHSPAPANTP